MKSLTLAAILAIPLFSFSQGVFTNQTNSALQKVIADYPNKFYNIKGALMSEDPQSTDYSSVVQIPGASQAVITRYSSNPEKEIYSWKCQLAVMEEFGLASKKYKELFDQIKNSIIKIEGQKPFILSGSYENPTEEKRFTSSIFTLLPSTGDVVKLKVELVMEYYVTEWKISLLVYDKEEEDDAEVVMD